MKKALPLAALACQFLLSSCTVHFSDAQKQQMTAVHLPQARTVANAYTEPNFTSAQDAAGANAASAVLGFGLVGALVSEGIMADERAGDASRNQAFTAAIAQHPPKDLGRLLSSSLEQQLRATPFYGPRLSTQPTAPARIDVTLKSYRLTSLDDTSFVPVLYADVDVVLNNQSIRQKTYVNPASPDMRSGSTAIMPPSATLAVYAANPQLLQAHFAQAAQILARDIAIDLQKAAGTP